MSQHNRRQFLEDSMFAAAALLGTAATRQVRAGEEGASGPNEKLGVAVVGVNGQGGSHLNAYAGRSDTEVIYVCDVDEAVGMRRIEQVTERQGRKPQLAVDIRKVLDDPSVDIVSIATPNHWHALASIWAMQAGKDVYVEKPVSHNVSEGRRIVQVARKHGKICQTGTQCRSNPGMRAAMQFIHSGGIGQVRLARGLCYKPRGSIGPRGVYQPPSSVNYDLWLGPAPMQQVTRPRFHYDWHWQWPYGNGDLGNQGIHQMDLARWSLQLDRLSDAVISYGGRFGYVDAGETANTQVIIHDYGDKSLVFEVRGLKTESLKGAKIGVIVEGSEGYVVIASYSGGIAFDRAGSEIRRFEGGASHFDNFLEAVRSRSHADLNADIEEGHLSSALCHLGNISYRLGNSMGIDELIERLGTVRVQDDVRETVERTVAHLRENQVDPAASPFQCGPWLAFDPQSERFTDSEPANEMLTREYRTPFVVPTQAEV